MTKILIVNTNSKQCGIYQFGYNISTALISYSSNYYYCEPKNLNEFENTLNNIKPQVVIVNYVPGLLNWVHSHSPNPLVTYLNIIHEPGQYSYLRQNCNPYFFNGSFYANPVRKLESHFVSMPRLLPEFTKQEYKESSKIKIGSFGFGFLSRGWLEIIDKVQSEFDSADIVFHMPFNSVVDLDGKNHALRTAELCRQKISKPNISLSINHNFLEAREAVDWLSQNTINLFLSQSKEKVGASSSIDFALAARRPIGISSSPMYDHLFEVRDQICMETRSIQNVVDQGISVLQPYYDRWNPIQFIKDFERLINGFIVKT